MIPSDAIDCLERVKRLGDTKDPCLACGEDGDVMVT